MSSKTTEQDSLRYKIPRLTYGYLETLIKKEEYHRVPETGVTVCTLILKNSYSVVADAVCANVSQFDEQTGQQQARRKAMKVLMELEQYLLKQRLYEAALKEESGDE